MKTHLFHWFVLLLILATVTVAEAAERQSCHLCGMYIDQYQHTAALLTDKDGKETATCGVADMIRFIEDSGGPDAFISIKVVDWNTEQKIDADSATYVIGSDLVPDMLPNVIAFGSKEAAEQFIAEHGGGLMSFTQALLSISPMGMTMPTRVNSAVTSPHGALGIGFGYMYMNMDDLMIGDDSVSFAEYLAEINPMMPMGPKEMTSEGEMFMLGYGITDRLSTMVKTKYLKKKMVMQNMMGDTTTRSEGMTDTDVSLRYNVWRDTYYSKFISLLGGITLPTGDFDSDPTMIKMSGLQLGIGTFGYYGGLLASARYGDFWFHSEASYSVKPENDDDYDFGDTAKIGLAVHYTPNPNFMIGLETDYTHTEKNEYNGAKVDNSGGNKAMVAVISSWRFFTAFGGNFNLKATAGIPYYEDLNAYGLGSNYFVNAMISFKRRIHN